MIMAGKAVFLGGYLLLSRQWFANKIADVFENPRVTYAYKCLLLKIWPNIEKSAKSEMKNLLV